MCDWAWHTVGDGGVVLMFYDDLHFYLGGGGGIELGAGYWTTKASNLTQVTKNA